VTATSGLLPRSSRISSAARRVNASPIV
jgi:hypothetical protein